MFSGRRYWEFEGRELVTDFPESGLSLTELGINELVPRIDAAAVGLGSLNRRVYCLVATSTGGYGRTEREVE